MDGEVAVPASRSRLVAVVGFSAAIAAAATFVLLTDQEIGRQSLGRVTPLLAILALLFGAMTIRFSTAGVPLLVAFVYLNLSQALVRYHEFPSLLQLLVIALAFAAWLKRDTAPIKVVLTEPLSLLLLGFVLLHLVTTTWSHDAELADARVMELAKSFTIFLLATLLMNSRQRVMQGVTALLASASILGVLVFVQLLRGDFANEYGGLARIKQAHIYGDVFQPRIAGPLGDPNFFAQILLIAVPVAALFGLTTRSRMKRHLAIAAGAIATATLLLTYSRGAMLALGVMGLMMLKALHIRWQTTAAGIALLAVLLVVMPRSVTERLVTIEEILPSAEEPLHPDSSFQERKLLMTVAWVMFVANPIVGVGAANYTTRYDDYVGSTSSAARQYADPADMHYPHNLYLEAAAETGLIGVTLFLVIATACWITLRRAERSLELRDGELAVIANGFAIALAGYLASALFLHLAFPRYLFLLFAFAASLPRIARQDRLQESNVVA